VGVSMVMRMRLGFDPYLTRFLGSCLRVPSPLVGEGQGEGFSFKAGGSRIPNCLHYAT